MAVIRGLVFCGLMVGGALLLASAVVGFLTVPGDGAPFGGINNNRDGLRLVVVAIVLIPCAALGIRALAVLTRQLAGRWCDVSVASPYRHPPSSADTDVWPPIARLVNWATDPATWRDALWVVANACVGWLLVGVPAGLVVGGGIVILGNLGFSNAHTLPPLLAVPLGVTMIAAGLWVGPRALPVYGRLARWALGPTERSELALRVHHLSETRSETIDAGAAAMRRIERDLHDGAQARLVAMGMTLDAAGQILETDPVAARALLAEAKDSSVKALAELRDLVRGIHPPVLADRGLAEAVRALALDAPLPVHVRSDLPGRPPPAAESAAYFSVSELLANVSKHAGAQRAWIDLRHSAGMLRIDITDDGCGGADPARGTGMRGIARRLAAFDGVMALSSPPGGPTAVNLEIPCALSSPKTSFS